MARALRLALIFSAGLLLPLTPAQATVRHATPATFNAQYAAAVGGDVVKLANGTYSMTGKVTPGTGRIVIGPEPGANPQMSFSFNGAVQRLTLNRLTITSGGFNSANAEQITIQNSDVPGQIVFRIDAGIQDAGIVLRNDDFHDWDWPACQCTYEGRVSVCGCGNSNFNNGITIRDSTFRGGASDGIQDSATGTRIIHNEFFGIASDDATGVHADPIQVWGGSGHVIAGNYFHDLPGVSVMMMPDGVDHEIVRDNVVAADPSMYPFAITWFADDSSIIRNNTLAYANNACAFAIDCGGIRMGTKGPSGSGTQVFNNLVGWINNETGTSSNRYNNLVASTDSGTLDPDEVMGVPTFTGGASPSTYCGYRLTPGSLGQGWGARTSLYC